MTEEVQEVQEGQEGQQAKSGKKGAVIALVALVALVALAVLAYSVLPNMQGSAPYDLTPADEVDPSMRATVAACTILDNDNNLRTLGDVIAESNKPAIMHVWASWC